MRLVLLGLFVLVVGIVSAGNQHGADIDDNEFAEFEELDEGTFCTLLYQIKKRKVA